MCGIFCICSAAAHRNKELSDTCKVCEENLKHRGPDSFFCKYTTADNYDFLFATSVLWLQGQSLVTQPVETDKSIFVYNGDIFSSSLMLEEEKRILGDTLLLLKHLENTSDVGSVLSCMHGPYAFVYLSRDKSKLYFGRDIFGRRSLLIGKSDGGLLLTSVATKNIKYDCRELPAVGTYFLDLRSHQINLIPWQVQNDNFSVKVNELQRFLNSVVNVIQELPLLQSRLFIDPAVVDLLIFEQIKQVNLNVAFETLLKHKNWSENVMKLNYLLENAIEKRISLQPKFCHACISQKNVCNHSLTGVLFSGGLDCTILALLADKFCDSERPIDLFNVAFEKEKNYRTPDRITGIASFEELKQLRPRRKWHFVEINVAEDELVLERIRRIRHLIYPLNTILDDSLGCALWFASRGENSNYKSPCRVLLVGMGADELFGGYTRHRAALKKQGWRGLHTSLNEDWQNISHRNLARDDRVVSDHGRQLRTPYLDEEVVDFARNLNCWEKTCPSDDLAQGLGEKILLRSLAYYLGLKNAASFKKRAMQFGSRIANNKEKAHEVSPRL